MPGNCAADGNFSRPGCRTKRESNHPISGPSSFATTGHGGSFPNINSTAIATTAIVTPAMPIGNRENGRLDHTGRGSNEGGGGRLSVTTISADDTSALMDSAAGSQTERS